jgi:hypothetical protein
MYRDPIWPDVVVIAAVAGMAAAAIAITWAVVA